MTAQREAAVATDSVFLVDFQKLAAGVEICSDSRQRSFKPSPTQIGRVFIMQLTPFGYPTSIPVLAASGAAGRRQISKKCPEIYSESHQKSFKPSPARIGQVSVSQLFRNNFRKFRVLVLAAGALFKKSPLAQFRPNMHVL